MYMWYVMYIRYVKYIRYVMYIKYVKYISNAMYIRYAIYIRYVMYIRYVYQVCRYKVAQVKFTLATLYLLVKKGEWTSVEYLNICIFNIILYSARKK